MNITDTIGYPDFLSIKDDCFPDEDIDQTTFDNNINRKNYLFAILDNTPCGYVLFDPNPSNTRLIHLCISQQFRSEGLGEQLLDHLRAHLIEKGCTVLRLNVDGANPRGLEFYKRNGFTLESETYRYRLLVGNPDGSIISLDKVSSEEVSEVQDRYNLGSGMIRFLMASKHSNLYTIKTEETLAGYLIYDDRTHTISPLVLDDFELLSPLINAFSTVVASGSEIQVEVTCDQIEQDPERYGNPVLEYKLQSLILNL